jgi:pSer/pThr/pTyr-binding forkhead associated (FHA) protein
VLQAIVKPLLETTKMPTLELSFRDKTISHYPLQPGVSLNIGRRKNNDIVIDNLAVSSHHAKIDSVGEGFVLIDLQSKNGLFVNEKQVGSHWLKQGDIISIGKHTLAFSYSEDEEEPETDLDIIEQTMAMDTSQYRSMLNKNLAAPTNEPKEPKEPNEPETVRLLVRPKSQDTIGILRFQAGGSGNYVCRQSITKIGKHRDSDIVIKGFTVGSTSATISRRPEGFYLSYVNGMARPKVNAIKITHGILLKSLDLIEIGSARLQFFERKRKKSKEERPKK